MTSADDPVHFPHTDGFWHDAAAALVIDDNLVSAHEEERFGRLKHTNRFPIAAVRACLADSRTSMADVDMIAVYFRETYWDDHLDDVRLYVSEAPLGRARDRIAHSLELVTGSKVDSDRITFVRHHLAHATACYRQSGFDSALVVTLDGAGDTEAGLVAVGTPSGIVIKTALPINQSLGGLYLWLTRYLGFSQFDEYKVMGLASYGDPNALRHRLSMFRLRPGGRHEIDWLFAKRLQAIAPARRAGEEVTQFHADVAASAQEALEECTLHLLRHHRLTTGQRRLCLAGGVAQNSALAGLIAQTEQFEEIFVHPAPHDAGCAIGAALDASGNNRPLRRIRTSSWGKDLLEGSVAAFEAWRGFAELGPSIDVVGPAADLLSQGTILPWVQGRAEFGPRALGHRSLLADPREQRTRDLINEQVKHREDFRPFAPVVRLEDAATYFDVPPGIDCSFMSYVLPVRPEWRCTLPAVTHVDGTARVQTLTFDQEPRLWNLLERFGDHAHIPVLLNTSLNVAGEPIVGSVDDLVELMLAASLPVGVFEDRLVQVDPSRLAELAISIPRDARVIRLIDSGECFRDPAVAGREAPDDRLGLVLERGGPRRARASMSDELGDALRRADGSRSMDELASTVSLKDEILALWRRRFLYLRPPRPDRGKRSGP